MKGSEMAAAFIYSCIQHSLKGCFSVMKMKNLALAQEMEWVVHLSEGRWFNPRLLQSTCRSVLGQGTEARIASDGCSISI